ncbi:MAG: hypothetical protein ACRD6W_18335, partial [Nitrososphaerales archaeon]
YLWIVCMNYTTILKASQDRISLSMNRELDGKLEAREPLNEEEKANVRAKATAYALLNRPSPPF